MASLLAKPTKPTAAQTKTTARMKLTLYSLSLLCSWLVVCQLAHCQQTLNAANHRPQFSMFRHKSPVQGADLHRQQHEVEILSQNQIDELSSLGQAKSLSNEVELVNIEPSFSVSEGEGEGGRGGKKCDSLALRRLDECSADLLAFGHRSAPYPLSERDMDSVYCANYNKTLSCVKSSSGCLSRFERQSLDWVISSTRRMNNKRCRNVAERSKFLRLTSTCLSQMGPRIDNCMDSYIVSLETIAGIGNRRLTSYPKDNNNDDIHHQIQLACCANKKFKQCVMDNAGDMCRPNISQKLIAKSSPTLHASRRHHNHHNHHNHHHNHNTEQKARNKANKSPPTPNRNARRLLQRAMGEIMRDMSATLDSMALTGPELICGATKMSFCETKFVGRYDVTVRRPRHKSIVPPMLKIYASS